MADCFEFEASVDKLCQWAQIEAMATMNISLPDQMRDWVESRSEDGTFSNNSDYLRHLIRQDQERQAAIAELQAEIQKGIDSGVAEAFDFSEFKARMRREYVG